MNRFWVVLFSAVLGFAPLSSGAGEDTRRVVTGALLGAGATLLSQEQREAILGYYRQHPVADADYVDEVEEVRGGKGKPRKELPPGLRKKLERGGELPPGWQRKVERGEVLDADLYRRSRPLPYELHSVLGEQPQMTELIRLQDKVIRVVRGEGTILDVVDLYEATRR